MRITLVMWGPRPHLDELSTMVYGAALQLWVILASLHTNVFVAYSHCNSLI